MTTDLMASTIAADLDAPLLGIDRPVLGIAPLDEATAGMLTFVVDPGKRAAQALAALRQGAVLLSTPEIRSLEHADGAVITVLNPRAAFAQTITRRFARPAQTGVAESARIHPDATVDSTATVGEYTVIRAGAVIGPRTEIRDHVVIGHDVRIGADCLIKSHAVIGEEGFGMDKDAEGNNFRIPHVGSVVITDHVEVGGFTTVCSGTISPTRVGDYTKIDDHVHIAHNCRIGRNVIITACAEISGSVIVEDDTWIGPNASVLQGVTLGEHSLLGIGAVAVKSVPADEVRIGNPARRLGDNKR
jgi:UDP-3-O-[3-hydroxymyristoyl] glucosamine N-acyltransferase